MISKNINSPVSAWRLGRQGREFESPHPDNIMQVFTTYILLSSSKNRYYVGHSNEIDHRFIEHNSGQTKSTKYGIPWKLVFTKDFSTKSEAVQLEIKIKKRGAERFLNDLKKINSSISAWRLCRQGREFFHWNPFGGISPPRQYRASIYTYILLNSS